ncbi:MAG: hypothetical protein HY064_13615 [Bacteroidetes bacterium]|nr:hypothetical protein [Bacteroidota bacterium]
MTWFIIAAVVLLIIIISANSSGKSRKETDDFYRAIVRGELKSVYANRHPSPLPQPFQKIADKYNQENIKLLDGDDEITAQKIRKLLISACTNENRNQPVFNKLLEELSRRGKEVKAKGGQQLVSAIKQRVSYLCGDDYLLYLYYMDRFDAPHAENENGE